MIRLILMRHGNTFEAGEVARQVGARTDLPLTMRGREQAEAMSRFLKGVNPKAIYAGGLKRQMESAKIIGDGLGVGVLHEPALTEVDYGAWEGLSAEEIVKGWPREYEEWGLGKWQGEIFGGSWEGHWRAIELWLDRLRKEGEGVVLGVTSNGLLRFFQNEKVKTGHFCEIHLFEDSYKIEKWNIDPQYGSTQNSMA